MRTDARVVIVGAGGHGKVVADALHRERPDAAFCFADDQPRLWGQTILGQEVLGRASDVLSEADWFHIAIGHNAFRAQAFEAMLAKAAAPLSIVHPSAHLSPFASVGRGAFLAAASVVAPSAKIGDAVIVNHGAIIDHDCDVGPYCHIAPGASLSGGVSLGPVSWWGPALVSFRGFELASTPSLALARWSPEMWAKASRWSVYRQEVL